MKTKKKTPTKIRETLMQMLDNVNIEDITVTQLCERANINRATFYYHFNSVHDVFTEIERDTENEFTTFLSRTALKQDGTPEKSFYVNVFDFVARNAPLCKMLINSPHKSNDNFLTRALAASRAKSISDLMQHYPNCPAAKIEYYYTFVSHGFLGLMTYWLNTGMRESVEEIAGIGEDVSNSGIKYLSITD